MSDVGDGNPKWIVEILVLALTAVGGFFANVVLARRRVGVEEKRVDREEASSLSDDERKFRAELRDDLKAIKQALAECEIERRECRERAIKTHAEIEGLRDEIRDLKARMTQQELPLQAKG